MYAVNCRGGKTDANESLSVKAVLTGQSYGTKTPLKNPDWLARNAVQTCGMLRSFAPLTARLVNGYILTVFGAAGGQRSHVPDHCRQTTAEPSRIASENRPREQLTAASSGGDMLVSSRLPWWLR
ncbi:hypothetical protein Bbelb_128910 [Branchiostoma belcheri]|nr:hypothetical protein Bbelb_128910 [Branchiostoma belcheri]